MSQPDQLLVTQKAFFDGIWHLRFINCGEGRIDDWHQGEPWQLFCGLNETIVVQINDDDCETSGIPAGPSVVYGIDPVIESMPSSSKTNAIVAQNYGFLVSLDDLTNFRLPRFISHSPISTIRLELEARFTSCFIEDLPDVIVFERRMKSFSRYDEDLRLFNSKSPGRVRIPPGFMLPVTIESLGRNYAAVYAVKEWKSQTDAIIECFVSRDVVVDENMLLVRRLSIPLTEVEVARVAKSRQTP